VGTRKTKVKVTTMRLTDEDRRNIEVIIASGAATTEMGAIRLALALWRPPVSRN